MRGSNLRGAGLSCLVLDHEGLARLEDRGLQCPCVLRGVSSPAKLGFAQGGIFGLTCWEIFGDVVVLK